MPISSPPPPFASLDDDEEGYDGGHVTCPSHQPSSLITPRMGARPVCPVPNLPLHPMSCLEDNEEKEGCDRRPLLSPVLPLLSCWQGGHQCKVRRTKGTSSSLHKMNAIFENTPVAHPLTHSHTPFSHPLTLSIPLTNPLSQGT